MTDSQFEELRRRAGQRKAFRDGVALCLLVGGVIAATALGLALT